MSASPEIPVHLVQLWLCDLCLDGAGGECHSPGCAMWINRAPDLPLRNNASVTVFGSPCEASPEQMLREFHASKVVHGGLMPPAPTADIPGWVRDLRMSLLDEEVGELREAVAAGDVVKIADALADIEFITRGTAVAYGIPSDAVFAEVFRSNMSKDNTPEEAKLVKGPRYEAPRIAEIFAAASGTGPGSPEVRTCYCGTTATVVPGVFPHRDCDGSVAAGTGPSAQDGDGAQ